MADSDSTLTPAVSSATADSRPKQARVPKPTTAAQKTRPVVNGWAVYSAEEVALHRKRKDCWVSFQGGVYDVTEWLKDHPGGADRILQHAGTDISVVFMQQPHRMAFTIIKEYRVGSLEGYEEPPGCCVLL